MNTTSSKSLFVAGMHRSGTSLTAKWLHDNNLFVGENLLSGYSDNKLGHYEDIEFLDISQSYFKKIGLHESGLFLKDHSQFKLDNGTMLEFSTLLKNRNNNHRIWGWKEPRCTLFMNDLIKLYPNLYVLAVFRNPNLVIESLYERLKRNKWYYTRNPLKRAKWYFQIDLNRVGLYSIFEKTYFQYNQSILNIVKNYPDRIILVESTNLSAFDNEITNWLGSKLDIQIRNSMSQSFITSLYNRTPKRKTYNLPLANEIYYKLKAESSMYGY